MTWDRNGTPTLGAILYGNNYVGGVAGYNDENATISSTKNLTISGQIVAAGKAVGGMIGLNYASTLPSATVKVSRVAGQQLVGGVIGANLPVGGFTVTGDGAFITNVTSGRVEADAVAGGIIGYNRLLAAKPAKVTLEALLPTIDQNTGVLTDSTDANTADGEVITMRFLEQAQPAGRHLRRRHRRRKRRQYEADDSKGNQRRNAERPVRRRPEPVQQRRV